MRGRVPRLASHTRGRFGKRRVNPDSFDVHEMHCQVLVARSNKRGDYLAKFRCDDDLIQNYWFSLFNDRLYVSQTNTEP